MDFTFTNRESTSNLLPLLIAGPTVRRRFYAPHTAADFPREFLSSYRVPLKDRRKEQTAIFSREKRFLPSRRFLSRPRIFSRMLDLARKLARLWLSCR